MEEGRQKIREKGCEHLAKTDWRKLQKIDLSIIILMKRTIRLDERDIFTWEIAPGKAIATLCIAAILSGVIGVIIGIIIDDESNKFYFEIF